jgi:hypothetical protein
MRIPAISDTSGARLKLIFMTFPKFYREATIAAVPARMQAA